MSYKNNSEEAAVRRKSWQLAARAQTDGVYWKASEVRGVRILLCCRTKILSSSWLSLEVCQSSRNGILFHRKKRSHVFPLDLKRYLSLMLECMFVIQWIHLTLKHPSSSSDGCVELVLLLISDTLLFSGVSACTCEQLCVCLRTHGLKQKSRKWNLIIAAPHWRTPASSQSMLTFTQ